MPTPITSLVTADTFSTWFNTTNTVISALNGISMYKGFAGDGVSITYDTSGNYTFSHSNTVTTGVTFNGNILFNGTVSFAGAVPSVSTTTISISPAVVGLTSGNIVTTHPTLGLTLAKADSASTSEVMGVVVSQSGAATVVAVGGSVDNTIFDKTISNALGISGATLTAGQAYFLSPTVAGGITTIEPNTFGHVSKPILLGITGSAGSILPYRGIVIEGISAGITAELDNKVIVQVDFSSNPAAITTTGNAIKVGDSFCVIYDDGFALPQLLINTGKYKLAGKLNSSSNTNCFVPDISVGNFNSMGDLLGSNFLGLISKIISTTATTYILEITTVGGSFNSNITDLDSNFYSASLDTGSYYVTFNGVDLELTPNTPMSNTIDYKFLDIIKLDGSTAKIILSKTQNTRDIISPIVSPLSSFAAFGGGGSNGGEYDNLLANGTFSIWQRNATSLTAGSLSTYSTPVADRWFIIKDGITGTTASISRQVFASDQISVPGSPLYYVDCAFQYTQPSSLNKRPKLENIQKEARLLQNQNATINFWAKSTIDGSTLDVVYNRYKDTYTSTAGVTADLANRVLVGTGGVTLTTSWTEYVYTFPVTTWGTTLGTTQSGWFGVGFEFPNSSTTVSLAQVQLDFNGNTGSVFYVSPDTELKRCKPYYQRTYDLGQTAGYPGSSTNNEQILQLANLNSQTVYFVNFPTEMVSSPTISLYTPNGILGDAYNMNSGKNMASSDATTVTYPWTTTTFTRISSASSYGNISVGSTSKKGMEISILSGAASLDALKFHYVADSDLNLNV